MASGLNAYDVHEAFNLILGRPPESEVTIVDHLNAYDSREALWAGMLATEEFRDNGLRRPDIDALLMMAVRRSMRSNGSLIDHEVSRETLALLLERIRAQWTRLGETDPHWSVLVQREFRTNELTEVARRDFAQSGVEMADLIALFEERTGAPISRRVCLELGCGVGRITRHLADKFDRVVAVDISPGNLTVCENYLRAEGVTNVELRLISNPTDFGMLPDIDLFFSVIVLQHNPPPVQKFILQAVLQKVRPGGAALFQIPTTMADYRFDVAEYLDTPHPTMEMHGLPTAIVLDTIRSAGLVVRDIAADPFIGIMGSNTFFAVRPL